MCIICNPALADAFRRLSYPSRRQFLRGASAVAAGPFIAEAVGPGSALADGSLNEALGNGLAGGTASDTQATIYVAARIVTMEDDNPTATAVAVAGKRIVAVGSLEEVKAALGDRPYAIDETFAGKIVMPGFIDQHLHPVLGALDACDRGHRHGGLGASRTNLQGGEQPRGVSGALKAAEAKLASPTEWLLTWGYHPLWHGKLDRTTLDAHQRRRARSRSGSAPATSSILNTPGLKALGLTEEMTQGKGSGQRTVELGGRTFLGERAEPDDRADAQGARHAGTPDLRAEANGRLRARQRRHRLQRARRPLHTGHVEALRANPRRAGYADVQHLPRRRARHPGPGRPRQGARGDRGADRCGARRPGQEAHVLPEADQALRRRRHHLAADADEGRLHRRASRRVDDHPGELEKRAQLYWNAGYQLHIHVNGDLGLDVVLDMLETPHARERRAPTIAR